jgi:cellulose synthase/poly-beta-1,6-N-acetylglucosamine synthase-like glycosyltransferase
MLYFSSVFSRRTPTVLKANADSSGVSIVIAVQNGTDKLLEHLPYITHQDYPVFEVVIVDDHSSEAEREKLHKHTTDMPKVRLIRSDRAQGKKHAITLGVEQAQHPLILCTDADCRPASRQWISQMVRHSSGEVMVLGVSPYCIRPGWLNLFVRFETLMTAMQYLSWALLGKPYMGVGRNLLYPRAMFLKVNPYADQAHIPYGDDDLWVQKAMKEAPVNVCIHKDAFVWSDPPLSWKAFFRQKHRHLSAGHHYSPDAWWKPGLFGMAFIGHWVLLLILVLACHLSFWVILSFGIGLLLRWMVVHLWATRFGERQTGMWYPLLEPVYALYLAVMGLYSAVSRKKTWS